MAQTKTNDQNKMPSQTVGSPLLRSPIGPSLPPSNNIEKPLDKASFKGLVTCSEALFIRSEISRVHSSEVIERLHSDIVSFFKESSDFLATLLSGDQPDATNMAKVLLEKREQFYSYIQSVYVSVAFVFKSDDDHINLKRLVQYNQFITDLCLYDKKLKGLLLQSLERFGGLSPMREFFWEVDRGPNDYHQRLGLDLLASVNALSDDEAVILEFGPGNGCFKRELDAAANSAKSFALCDRLHYRIDSLLMNLIDFDLLAEHGANLSDTEKRILCDFLYKILFIKADQSHLECFEYDTEVIDAIAKNIHQIKPLLSNKIGLLETTKSIPTGGGMPNDQGRMIYDRQAKPETNNFQTGCNLLVQNITTYIKESEGLALYEYIDAYPLGIMIGDFKDVSRIKDNQVGLSFGVRSTVYLEGPEYEVFIRDMVRVTIDSGLAVNDDVRENHGVSNRVYQLKHLGVAMHIIMGPGVANEEGPQITPLARLVGSESSVDLIIQNFPDGYQISALEDLADDPDSVGL